MADAYPYIDNNYQAEIYKPRKPTDTPLYKIIQEHLETYLEKFAQENNFEGVPEYVEREFYKYLECGILANGFARVYCDNCKKELILGFSCKSKSLCPSCTTKYKVNTAAYLVDSVLPRVPIKQWVLSVPKRVRYYMLHNKKVAGDILKIFLRAVEYTLRKCSPGAPVSSKTGGVAFIHRFGSYLNPNCHFHVCVIDGVFHTSDDEAIFTEATDFTDDDTLTVTQKVRRRVAKYLVRHNILEDWDAQNMLRAEDHTAGFSVHSSVRIEAHDRYGLEQLVRYCARPPFALGRLYYPNKNLVVYQLKKPTSDGKYELNMDPLEFIHRLSDIITPPNTHRHRYFGVLAPNSSMRKKVIETAGPSYAMMQQMNQAHDKMYVNKKDNKDIDSLMTEEKFAKIKPKLYTWAMLLARVYEALPLLCPVCDSPMRIISFITEPEMIKQILNHIGEESTAPLLTPYRGPPDELEFEF